MSTSLLSFHDRLLVDDEQRSLLNPSDSSETIDSHLDCLPVKYLGCVRCSSKSKILKHGIQSVQSEILYLYATAQRKSLAGSYLRPLTLPTESYQLIDVCNYGIVIGERDPTAHTTLDINGNSCNNSQLGKIVVTKVITPLANIVLWASIKFTHNIIKIKGHRVLAGAFLPISCSQAVFQRNTFIRLTNRQKFLLTLPHPPLFLCILRKVSSPQVYECHLFSCFSTKDAITISAKLSDLQNASTAKIASLTVPCITSEIASHTYTSHRGSSESRLSSHRPTTNRSLISNSHLSQLNAIRQSTIPTHTNGSTSLKQNQLSTSPSIDRYPFSAVDTDFLRYAKSDLSSSHRHHHLDHHHQNHHHHHQYEPFFGTRYNGIFNRKPIRSNVMKIRSTNGRVSSCDLVSCKSTSIFKPSIISTKSNHRHHQHRENQDHSCCCCDDDDHAYRNRVKSYNNNCWMIKNDPHSSIKSGIKSRITTNHHNNNHTSDICYVNPINPRKHGLELAKNRHDLSDKKITKSDLSVTRADTSACPTCESCPECKLNYVKNVDKRQTNSNDSGYPSKSGSIDHTNDYRGHDTVDDNINRIKVKERIKTLRDIVDDKIEVNNYNGYIVQVDYDANNNDDNYVPKIVKSDYPSNQLHSHHLNADLNRNKFRKNRLIKTNNSNDNFYSRKAYNPLANGTSIKFPLDRFEEVDESTLELVNNNDPVNCVADDNFCNQNSSTNGDNYECQQCDAIIRDSSELSCEQSSPLFGDGESNLIDNDKYPPLRPIKAPANLTRWRSIENLRFKPVKSKSIAGKLTKFRFRSWVRKNLRFKRKKKQRPELFFDRELRYLSLAEPLDYIGSSTRYTNPDASTGNQINSTSANLNESNQASSSALLTVHKNGDNNDDDVVDHEIAPLLGARVKRGENKSVDQAKLDLINCSNSKACVSLNGESVCKNKPNQRNGLKERQIKKTSNEMDNLRPKNLSQVNLLQELGYLP